MELNAKKLAMAGAKAAGLGLRGLRFGGSHSAKLKRQACGLADPRARCEQNFAAAGPRGQDSLLAL